MSKILTMFKMMKRKNSEQFLKSVFLNFSRLPMSRVVSDASYLKLQYRINTGKKLNLKTPISFNEKLQWLKLYDRNEVYTNMVDKYEAKKIFSEIYGEDHVIPTYGVWSSFDEINFELLPEQFVLKCTHDSGSIVICRDKTSFDKRAAKEKIEKCLRHNGYWYGREWPYKNVRPRIIAEKYMEERNTDGSIKEMTDYKFYCFNGEPRFLYVSAGLEHHETAHISFFTTEWDFAPFGRSDYTPFTQLPEKPKHFDEMLKIAKEVSHNIPFLRVDLYDIGDKILFSEFTFTPNSGYMPFSPFEWDEELGSMLTLPKNVSK